MGIVAAPIGAPIGSAIGVRLGGDIEKQENRLIPTTISAFKGEAMSLALNILIPIPFIWPIVPVLFSVDEYNRYAIPQGLSNYKYSLSLDPLRTSWGFGRLFKLSREGSYQRKTKTE